MSISEAQHRAIHARGNVLVSAGAGTGKTRTLVERCLSCLLDEKHPASIDEILMVTFTEAAAAEMRRRIRERLEQEEKQSPNPGRWQEQLAIFETANIGTLHSFCLQLVRRHFYELGLDPQLAVLAEEEARVLAEETLDTIFQRHYSGSNEEAAAVQRLVQTQGRGWDQPIRGLIIQLHHYAQTLADPTGWIEKQRKMFENSEPAVWRGWFRNAVVEFSQAWLEPLDSAAPVNPIAAASADALRRIKKTPSAEVLHGAFADINAARENVPRGRKKAWVDPFGDFFSDAIFLSSLTFGPGQEDPLAEDWKWVRENMLVLLGLLSEFGSAFAEEKRELAVLDFHDLEQFTLQLLWDAEKSQVTETGRALREKLRFVFVDEYQDINAAQDKIVECLSRESLQANRFLVGDVKQSIYRFRLASPAIFQRYASDWKESSGQVIQLVENFRAREGLLHCINSIFEKLLTSERGGVDYRDGNALQFGAPERRAHLRAHPQAPAPVELHLILKGKPSSAAEDEEPVENLANLDDLLDAEKEARLVAMRLRQLRDDRTQIWDAVTGEFRAVRWGDMAILLRAPAAKAESYAKEFARAGIPLQLARRGFYRSIEVLDLLSLLQLLDNPLQDIPALAVLRSPLVGLSLVDLAEIRLVSPKAPFWTALAGWYGKASEKAGGTGESKAREKVGKFMERFSRWRRMVQQSSLSRCLETVLAETHYDSWVLAKLDGLQRHANIQRLIGVARQFDQFQRQSLFRFLKYIEGQQSSQNEPEIPAVASEDAVRLMSIHQSKGLEFPVVVAADLGKPFNASDLRKEVILDEEYGLCPHIKPPHSGSRYPSLAHWLGARHQKRELFSEELRLLYVASTRARDILILTGTITQKKLESDWNKPDKSAPEKRSDPRSYLDWLGHWFQENMGDVIRGPGSGDSSLLRWFVHEDQTLVTRGAEGPAVCTGSSLPTSDPGAEALKELELRLGWKYPFEAATRQAAKTSVSVLRRQAADDDSETVPLVKGRDASAMVRRSRRSSVLDAAEVGQAHHLFLQFFRLEIGGDLASLRQDADRMVRDGRLSREQADALDFEGLSDFWMSDVGGQIRSQSQYVHRELAFTARFSIDELARFKVEANDTGSEEDFVIVQGVADLVIIAPEEIWLLDFKTDRLTLADLPGRVVVYRPQLQLYAMALNRIYRRPVTKAWLHFIGLKQSIAAGGD